ncbi:MAG: SRPBCC domain-containing protein [Betaproteobacteria bacterium]|nr:SRPBCC domain-containing protein [Betaproteobacteria bacterium]
MSTAQARKAKPAAAAKTPAKPAARKKAGLRSKSRGTTPEESAAPVKRPAARSPAATKPAAPRPAAKRPAAKRPPARKAPAAVQARPPRARKPAPPGPGIVATLAGISSAAVAKATGHGWDFWLSALDKAGAARLPHKDIVKILYDQLGLRKNWWVQMVTVGYEQARGLRKLNEKTDGFVATVSRTVAVPITALFAAWEEGRRGDWFPNALEVRRATKNKSMRITWPDGSGVDVNFYDKGGSKAVVAIEHGKLPDEGAVAAVKDLWGSALDRLKSTLEGKF